MSEIWAQPSGTALLRVSEYFRFNWGNRLGIRGLGSIQEATPRSRLTRLGVNSQAMIDDDRCLVVVRRDDVEHVLLIGGGYNDLVVERTIVRDSPRRSDVDPLLLIAGQAVQYPPLTLAEDTTNFPLQPSTVPTRSLGDILNSLPDDD